MLRRVRQFQVLSIFGMLLVAGIVSTIATSPSLDRHSLSNSRTENYGQSHHTRRLMSESESEELENYPADIFTKKERKSGAAILHLLGACYMFAALALVCDEFFVPSLEVITDKLQLSDDVAGATFLAAGGSAPELATSFMGTFISKSNVGFGTIVGSAVFNILFVIGACAYFSSVVLQLTWWPLFRDTVYYCVSLAILSALFYDHLIYWWEALIMFSMYAWYVVIMSVNEKLEYNFKSCLRSAGFGIEKVHPAEQDHGGDKKSSESKGGTPMSLSRQHTQMHYKLHKHFQASALSRQTLDRNPNPLTISVPPNEKIKEDSSLNSPNDTVDNSKTIDSAYSPKPSDPPQPEKARDGFLLVCKEKDNGGDRKLPTSSGKDPEGGEREERKEDDDDDDDDDLPMDLAFPKSTLKRIIYLLLAPLMYCLYYTVPDVRRKGYEQLYILAFFLSVCWIGTFSFFMVWWITVLGDAMGIPSEVMGLTILAIGTSVPDLLESVIVAKQGKGDMAVSSSLGSNIFDITVGLPLPWLIYTIMHGSSIAVGTDGLFISVIMLFFMLASCVTVIACMNWKMSRSLGVAFFALWIVFLAVSLVVEYTS